SSGEVTTPPPAWPAGAAPRPPWRSPPARRGSRSPRPGPSSPPASRACARAGRAALPRSSAVLPPIRSRSLLDDSAQNPVDESSSILRRVALGERDCLVDRNLGRHFAAVELDDRHAQDVPLECAEPVGRPLVGGCGDPHIQLLVLGDDRLRQLPRERVDLALEQGGQLLPGDVPLVEQDERRAARGPAAGHQPISAISTSTRSTSRPVTCVRASPTRSCTARASPGSGSAGVAPSSMETDARPSACRTST